jgi:transketolase
MAIASKFLGAKYNRPGFTLFDFDVYTLCSDGDLMEGISSEAASIAGHLKLSNLCWIYDDNGITIEGHTDLAFSENMAMKFKGLGWHTIHVKDANDRGALQAAFDEFKATDDRPTLIVVNSIIGFGSPNKANSHGAHGAPLGEEECKLTKKIYGWPENEKFLVPPEVRQHFAQTMGARGSKASSDWNALFADYTKKYPTEAAEVQSILDGTLPADWDKGLKPFAADAKGMATRVSSGKVLNMLSPHIPQLIGGSADLAPSTMTLIDGEKDFLPSNYSGRNMHFGIREHGMASALNGMSLCGLRPYGATFFVFTDYMRPSDTPTDRAPSGLPIHSRLVRFSTRRCQRSPSLLPSRIATEQASKRDGFVQAKRPDDGFYQGFKRSRCRERWICRKRLPRYPESDFDWYRNRTDALHQGPGAAR